MSESVFTETLTEFHVPAAKALIGAYFIEYIVYALFYVLEGFKFQEFYGDDKAQTNKGGARNGAASANGTGQPEGEEVDNREIKIDVPEEQAEGGEEEN